MFLNTIFGTGRTGRIYVSYWIKKYDFLELTQWTRSARSEKRISSKYSLFSPRFSYVLKYPLIKLILYGIPMFMYFNF